jgi:transcription elongation factor Elf1
MRRRSPATPQPAAGLEMCPVCNRDFVQPVSWEPAGEAAWWMFLRCGECGMSREVAVSHTEADRFERALHARASMLAAEARRLEEERLSAEIDAFVHALDRDLIDADFFA